MANNVTSLNDLFKELYGGKSKKNMTAEDWATQLDVTAEDLETYPNAVVGTSPLMQALVEEGTKRDWTKGAIGELVPDGVKLTNMVKFSSPFTGKQQGIVSPAVYDKLEKSLKK